MICNDLGKLIKHLASKGLDDLTVDDIRELLQYYSDPSVNASMAESIQLWNAIVARCNALPLELKSIHAPVETRIKELSTMLFERSMGEFDEFKGLRLAEMYLRLCKLLRIVKDMTRHRLYLERSKSVLGQIAGIPLLNSICRNRLAELKSLLALELIIVGDIVTVKEDIDGDIFGSALIEEIDRDPKMARLLEGLDRQQFSKTIKVQLHVRYADYLLGEKKVQEAKRIAAELHEEFPHDDASFLSYVKCIVALKLPFDPAMFAPFKSETKAMAAEMIAKSLGTAKTMEMLPDLPLHSKISITLADSKSSDAQKAEMIDFLLTKSAIDFEGEERCVFQLFEAADKCIKPEISKMLFTMCLTLAEKVRSQVDLETIKRRLFDCCLSLGQVDEAKRYMGVEGWQVKRFKMACIEENREEALRTVQACRDEDVPELIVVLQDYDSLGVERELLIRPLSDVPFIVLLHLMIERGLEVDISLAMNRISHLIVNEENASGLWNLCLVAINHRLYPLCKPLCIAFRERFALGEEERRAALVLLILCASEYTEELDCRYLEELQVKRPGNKRKRGFVKLDADELPLLIRLATLKLTVKLGLPLEEGEELEVLVRLAQLLYFDPQIDQSGKNIFNDE